MEDTKFQNNISLHMFPSENATPTKKPNAGITKTKNSTTLEVNGLIFSCVTKSGGGSKISLILPKNVHQNL